MTDAGIAAVLVSASLREGRVETSETDEELRGLVADGQILIFKNAFPPDLVLELRRSLLRFAGENDPFPNGQSPDTRPDLNYHRIDDGSIPSAIPHVFHQFGINDIDKLPDYARVPARPTAEALRDLHNRMAGSDFDFSLQGLRLKVLHYPTGGGFLERHAHTLDPQRVGLILGASRLGVDLEHGGTYFDTPAGVVDVARDHDLGDVVCFRYDLPHGISPVDERGPVNWQAEAGKWSIVLELRDSHARSRAA